MFVKFKTLLPRRCDFQLDFSSHFNSSYVYNFEFQFFYAAQLITRKIDTPVTSTVYTLFVIIYFLSIVFSIKISCRDSELMTSGDNDSLVRGHFRFTKFK